MDATSINMMKYFTRQWCWGDLSDKKVKEISEKYDHYISCIYSKLVFPLKLLAKNINLHDGMIEKLTISPSKENLTLYGVFGDLEIGYFNLKIEYEKIKDFDLDATFCTFINKKMEVTRDELEVVEKNKGVIFVHRFLFSNKSEFQIKFCDCNLKIESANAKNYRKKFCSLVGFQKK